ncbi:hypothetical protein JOF35_005131 [Streptomyces demainii]|uniref:Uncharacterized protein n=1 Tax=Streptomyces demainii TaxID=588122 RepID=A0ABT9KWP1_9ACTN|nr:hypothetical protein [Streptomyces demainii]MDP9612854.1 hypothetical protein [Streptomyces demainii]
MVADSDVRGAAHGRTQCGGQLADVRAAAPVAGEFEVVADVLGELVKVFGTGIVPLVYALVGVGYDHQRDACSVEAGQDGQVQCGAVLCLIDDDLEEAVREQVGAGRVAGMLQCCDAYFEPGHVAVRLP